MQNEIKKTVVDGLRNYVERIRLFRLNARLYLLTVLITGVAMGVYRLLFNFYVLSLGYDEAVLGNLITTNQMTALLLALPMGYIVDRFGRKKALITRSLLLAGSVTGIAIFPNLAVFFAMNVVFGIVQSLSAVATAPFLMENSGEEERTYLFSFTSGLQMGSVFVGNWLGGYLPSWVGALRDFNPTSSSAYGGSLFAISLVAIVGFIPLLFIKPIKVKGGKDKNFSPFEFARNHPKLLSKILIPTLFISIGAGLFIPFMNVFFRVVHGQSDQVIGTLFAWGSLAMGIGLIIAPPIADRIGKIQLVMVTQGLAIPFMIMLGFSPVFGMSAAAYFIRMALMNMSNPIYQTFIMEQVDSTSRATVASLYSMVWSFGRAFSPSVSGWLQVAYGFDPVFGCAIVLYGIAITLYYVFFLRKGKKNESMA